MTEGEIRRKRIQELLSGHRGPLTGHELARQLGVSRQVIVQDIALLRAAGQQVLATPQGYMLADALVTPSFSRTVACRHGVDMERELLAIVDTGARVVDVMVEHPLYGEIRGLLMLESRLQVAEFLSRLRESGAQPLATLTGGVHLHTLEARDEVTLRRAVEALRREGILLTEEK